MKNTILIVEDEGSLSGYLTKELQFEDFNVLVAADGLAAMETYQAHQNELLLILLDWMLPKLDGMEVLRRIRKHDQVPVIIMTARDYVGDKVAGLEMVPTTISPNHLKSKNYWPESGLSNDALKIKLNPIKSTNWMMSS